MIPFKITLPATENTAKIFETNFEQFYPEVNTNTRWVEIKPYIEQSIQESILPYLGSALYDDLMTKYHANTTLSANQTQLLKLLQTAAAWYAIGNCLPQKLDIITSAGNQQVTPEHSTPTAQWAFNKKIGDTLRQSDKKLDTLLSFLEFSTDPYFNLWRNDPAYNRGKNDLFKTTSDFSAYQNILDSRRTFIALAPSVRDVVNLKIKPLISEAMYNELIAQYKTNSLTANNLLLFEKIRLAAAKLSVALALRTMPFFIESDGVRAVSSTDGVDRNYAERMKQTADACERIGYEYLEALSNFIFQNADNYPTYKTSSAYPSTVERSKVLTSPNGLGGIMLT